MLQYRRIGLRRPITDIHVRASVHIGVYLGHISTSDGFAAVLKRGIMNYFAANSISFDRFVAIGCYGTSVNKDQTAALSD